MIIDCHTHVVSPDHERYPLNPRELSGQWYLTGPASAEDLAKEMADSGVDRAILVQGVGAYTYDNRYAADAARARPDLFVSACAIDVLADDALTVFESWIRESGMQGVRLFALSREGPSFLTQESTFPLWHRARELSAHIIVTILPHQLGELESVLKRFPETPISLDHCGFATKESHFREQLFALAAYPNLNLKISTHNIDDAIKSEGSAQPMAHELVRHFGAERLMWGSDFCQTHDRPYARLVDLALDAFGGLSESDREACLSGTALRLWPGLHPA